MKNRTALFALLPWVLVLCVSCGKKAEDEGAAIPKMEVQIYKAKVKDFSADITSYGSIIYTKKNDITTAVDGIIKHLNLKEGDAVHAGQELAELSNIQLTIQRDKARSALTQAIAATNLSRSEYADYRRQIESLFLTIEKKEIEIKRNKRNLESMDADLRDKQKLLDIGGITEETIRSARLARENSGSDYEMLQKEADISRIGLRDIDLSNEGLPIPSDAEKKRKLLIDLNSRTKKAELDAAIAQETTTQTELSSADALINELVIKAPIEGIVGAVYKEPGERVASGDKLLTIFSSDDAWIVFPVNEDDLYRLRKGMQATITVQSIQQEPIRGVIDIISPTVDPQSGNVSVKALVKKMGNRGKPGMFASVSVSTGIPAKKILIPLSCLAQREDKNGTIMTVRNKRLFKRKVELGIEYKGEIEITDGLSDGESVVLEPTPLLKEGDEVSVYEK